MESSIHRLMRLMAIFALCMCAVSAQGSDPTTFIRAYPAVSITNCGGSPYNITTQAWQVDTCTYVIKYSIFGRPGISDFGFSLAPQPGRTIAVSGCSDNEYSTSGGASNQCTTNGPYAMWEASGSLIKIDETEGCDEQATFYVTASLTQLVTDGTGVLGLKGGDSCWTCNRVPYSFASVSSCSQPSSSPSPTRSSSPSASRVPSPSSSTFPSPSRSASPSPSPTTSPSSSPSNSAAPSPSSSPSVSILPSPSSSPSTSPSSTPSPSVSASSLPSSSPSVSPSVLPSASASPSASILPSASSSITASPSVSVLPSPSSLPSASVSPSPSTSGSPSASSLPSASTSPLASPVPSASSSPSFSPSALPSASSLPSPSRTPVSSPVPSPSASSSPRIVSTPQPSPSPSAPFCPYNARLEAIFPGAGRFSVVLLGDTSSANNTATLDLINGDFEARAAVRGSVKLMNFGINQAVVCDSQEAAGWGFIVEGPGQFEFVNGQLFCGNLLISTEVKIISLPSFVGNGGLVIGNVPERSGLDFDAVEAKLKDASQGLCESPSTPAEVTAWGGITLTSTGQAYESFSIAASDLSHATSMRLAGFDRNVVKEVVINVVGGSALSLANFYVDVGNVPLRSIIWNVCDANLVVIQAFQFPGALLAPSADVVLQNAVVVGQVYGRTLRGSGGGQINIPPCP